MQILRSDLKYFIRLKQKKDSEKIDFLGARIFSRSSGLKLEWL
jgi:hypothetical protein